MTIMERIAGEIRDAMRAGDATRRDALRLLYSSLQRAEKDSADGFDDERAMAVLRSERKRRVEAAEAYESAGQPERGAAERGEIEVIDEFLPAAMGEQELTALVDAVIAETGASSMKDMGRVMGMVTQRSGGRADGRAAADLVRSRLST